MNTRKWPPILYGAVLLAAFSLLWSGYAISDLMDSGKFGLSVAVAGDVGWITVLWAEYKGVTIAGRRWPAAAAGWLIAAGVTVLLVLHGAEYSRAQAIAGPFVVLVGKAAWVFTLAAMRDRTAPTPQQQSEIDTVIRDSSHAAQVNKARSDAEIARIREQARVTLARDQADFEIWLERVRKRAELERRTPLAITPSSEQPGFERTAEQATEVAQAARPAIAPEPSTAPRKRQPPAAPAGPSGEVVEDVSALFASAHAPVVYFLRNGTRVKIGTSQNLRRRITSLSLRREDVIRVEHGDQQHERSLHRRFEDLRVDETEWFELRGALSEYLGLGVAPDTLSARPGTGPDTSGHPGSEGDGPSGHDESARETGPLTSPDTRPDSPDPLSEIAKAASGPSELARSLVAHGVPLNDLVSEAVRLRPDMVPDSVRRAADRLQKKAGPYL